MAGVFGKRTLRCSDGHVFTSTQAGRLFLSVHLGPKRYARCPVDGKWRIMSNVWSGDAASGTDTPGSPG